MKKIDSLMRERARILRRTLTDAEQLLWQALKKRQMNGIKFRRQYLIGYYIIDFICLSYKLIIEVDGSQHQTQVEYDTIRTEFLKAGGYRVLRFWNHEVLQDLDSVLGSIWYTLFFTPTPTLPRKAREGV